jgi:hypothetical protein
VKIRDIVKVTRTIDVTVGNPRTQTLFPFNVAGLIQRPESMVVVTGSIGQIRRNLHDGYWGVWFPFDPLDGIEVVVAEADLELIQPAPG